MPIESYVREQNRKKKKSIYYYKKKYGLLNDTMFHNMDLDEQLNFLYAYKYYGR